MKANKTDYLTPFLFGKLTENKSSIVKNEATLPKRVRNTLLFNHLEPQDITNLKSSCKTAYSALKHINTKSKLINWNDFKKLKKESLEQNFYIVKADNMLNVINNFKQLNKYNIQIAYQDSSPNKTQLPTLFNSLLIAAVNHPQKVKQLKFHTLELVCTEIHKTVLKYLKLDIKTKDAYTRILNAIQRINTLIVHFDSDSRTLEETLKSKIFKINNAKKLIYSGNEYHSHIAPIKYFPKVQYLTVPSNYSEIPKLHPNIKHLTFKSYPYTTFQSSLNLIKEYDKLKHLATLSYRLVINNFTEKYCENKIIFQNTQNLLLHIDTIISKIKQEKSRIINFPYTRLEIISNKNCMKIFTNALIQVLKKFPNLIHLKIILNPINTTFTNLNLNRKLPIASNFTNYITKKIKSVPILQKIITAIAIISFFSTCPIQSSSKTYNIKP